MYRWGTGMIKMNKTYLEQLKDILPQLSHWVKEDVEQRAKDWIKSGGKEDDLYIKNQLEYAKRVIALKDVK